MKSPPEGSIRRPDGNYELKCEFLASIRSAKTMATETLVFSPKGELIHVKRTRRVA